MNEDIAFVLKTLRIWHDMQLAILNHDDINVVTFAIHAGNQNVANPELVCLALGYLEAAIKDIEENPQLWSITDECR